MAQVSKETRSYLVIGVGFAAIAFLLYQIVRMIRSGNFAVAARVAAAENAAAARVSVAENAAAQRIASADRVVEKSAALRQQYARKNAELEALVAKAEAQVDAYSPAPAPKPLTRWERVKAKLPSKRDAAMAAAAGGTAALAYAMPRGVPQVREFLGQVPLNPQSLPGQSVNPAYAWNAAKKAAATAATAAKASKRYLKPSGFSWKVY